MLLTIEGTYQNGQIHLNDEVPFVQKKKVIVTFLEEATDSATPNRLTLDSFSFKKTRAALKTDQGSFSDEVIKERRKSL